MKYEEVYSIIEEVFSLLSRMSVSGENTLLAGVAMSKLRGLGIELQSVMQDESNYNNDGGL